MHVKVLHENLRQRFGDRLVALGLKFEGMVPNRLRKELRQRPDLRWLLHPALPDSEEAWNYLGFQLKGDVGAPSESQLRLLLGSAVQSVVNGTGEPTGQTNGAPLTTTQSTQSGGERILMSTPDTAVTAPGAASAPAATPATAAAAVPSSPPTPPAATATATTSTSSAAPPPPPAREFKWQVVVVLLGVLGLVGLIATSLIRGPSTSSPDADPKVGSQSTKETPAPRDTTPPSLPANLLATPLSGTGAILTWNPATDDIGVTAYRVFRGSALVTTVAAPAVTFTDSGLVPGATYTYTVVAVDAAGNNSPASAAVSVTTTAPPSNPVNPDTKNNIQVGGKDRVDVDFVLPDLYLNYVDSRGVRCGSIMLERLTSPHPAMAPRFSLLKELGILLSASIPEARKGPPPVVSIESAIEDKIEAKVKPVSEGVKRLEGEVSGIKSDVGGMKADLQGFKEEVGRKFDNLGKILEERLPAPAATPPTSAQKNENGTKPDEKKAAPAPEPPKAPPPAAEAAPAPTLPPAAKPPTPTS